VGSKTEGIFRISILSMKVVLPEHPDASSERGWEITECRNQLPTGII